MLIAFVLLSTTAGYAIQTKGVVIGDNVTVRNGAGFNEQATGMVSIGTNIVIHQEINGWYEVTSDETIAQGWIFSDLVTVIEPGTVSRVQKGIVTASVLNVRVSPSITSHRITQLLANQQVSIIETMNEWIRIVMNDCQKGWVHGEYIEVIPNLPTAAVSTDQAKLYAAGSTTAQVLDTLELGATVYVINYADNYYHAKNQAGVEGWIPREHVSLIINGNNPVSRSGFRNAEHDLVTTAKKYLGSPYVYGAAGPNRFDCSGYVFFILRSYYSDLLTQNNISLPRSSRAMAGVGTPVSKDALEIGDLVFFNNTSGNINHVGLYIGNQQFIHASSGRSMGVIISPLNTGTYLTRYATARRLFTR